MTERPVEHCANNEPHEGHVYGEPEPVPNWGSWCPGRVVTACMTDGHDIEVLFTFDGEPSQLLCRRTGCAEVWQVESKK